MNSLILKVCGITNVDDALTAIHCGADWLGLIFVPGTPRALDLNQAAEIAKAVRKKKPDAPFIGVFQNAELSTIQQHFTQLKLNAVQLHGDESPAFCAQISAPIIKTLMLQSDTSASVLEQQAAAYQALPNFKSFLLDLPKNTAAKSLLAFEHPKAIQTFLQAFPSLVAGGLNPDNIASVLELYCPYGVDVASGVEQSPGRKSPEKLRAFGEAVHRFKHNAQPGGKTPCNP